MALHGVDAHLISYAATPRHAFALLVDPLIESGNKGNWLRSPRSSCMTCSCDAVTPSGYSRHPQARTGRGHPGDRSLRPTICLSMRWCGTRSIKACSPKRENLSI